jgi:hypothetical protein
VIASVAGLSLALLLSPARAARTPATPAATDCGAEISAWGPGTVDDIQVALLSIVSGDAFATPSPEATPSAEGAATHFAEIEITNIGQNVATVVAHDIKLVLCDGSVLDPTADPSHPALGDVEVPAGELRTGWVAFAVPANAVPVRLIVPVSRPGLTGGRVEFPLVDAQTASGADGTTGATGAVGADAVGGDAIGGDGADGADATADNGT